DPALVILDARHDLMQPETWGEAEYRAGHIPGARFVHVDHDLSAPKTGTNGRHPLPPPATAAATFGRLGIDAGKQVVAYDQGGGMFAARLWWMLRWLGHDAVALLDGGFAKWTRERRPVTTATPAARPTTFAIRHVGATASADDVLASLADHSLTLVDARTPERFRGETEPMDPVAGHIPGALNRPYAQNLTADATWKSAAQLREEFGALLAATPPDKVVNHCGSGVTAGHNILAMEIAGLAGSRLYPGSWSEWVADPARPVARGESY
ncbi:MAG TPA: sulfurtransferase, partial [Casimicrobiaceae bacterium]